MINGFKTLGRNFVAETLCVLIFIKYKCFNPLTSI